LNNTRAALDRTYEHALDWLDGMPKRRVNAAATAEQLVRNVDGPLPNDPADPA
jgi:hypothetical protein